jgi:hypothetical protein
MVLESDQFVATCFSTHFEHDCIPSICSQVREDGMFREVEVLEADNFSIV